MDHEKQNYIVLSPVHADRLYSEGEDIDLTVEDARPLLDIGVIAPHPDVAQDHIPWVLDDQRGADADESRNASAQFIEELESLDSAELMEIALIVAERPELSDRLEMLITITDAQDADVRSDMITAAVARILTGILTGTTSEDDLTKSGAPKVSAVERESGLTDVTSDERDAALTALERSDSGEDSGENG